MTDNLNRARATKVLYKGKDTNGNDIFENEKSGVVNNFLSGSLYIKIGI